jgi:cytochrome c-type biogenesis protein CcmH/NrfG
MPNEIVEQATGGSNWQAKQVYAMAVISLVVGLAIGYLFRGSQSGASATRGQCPASTAPAGGMGGQMPSLDQMKHMADKKAAPLLEKLKSDPTNVDLLGRSGTFIKLLTNSRMRPAITAGPCRTDPKNVAMRTQLASSLYYTAMWTGRSPNCRQSLQYDPKDANSLFNLGMIKWRGKQDSKGALVAWRELLK